MKAKEIRVPQFDLEPTLTYQGVEYFSAADAAKFAGMSRQGLSQKLRKWNEEHPISQQIPTISMGSKQVYYKVSDMRRLIQPTVKQ